MVFETVEFQGIPDCIHLANEEVELIVSTGFGPRILRYAYIGKANLFHLFSKELGHRNISFWQNYGGHRLWHAPEVYPRTYAPDNDPVPYEWRDDCLYLYPKREKETGLRKEISISMDKEGTGVQIDHYLINEGPWPVEVSAWCLSVMEEGGELFVPQEDFKPHPDCLAPARPLVLWPFNDMSDPRFSWGSSYIRMRQDNDYQTKLKFGVQNSKGWAAYRLDDQLFIKRFPWEEGACYPDMGCNAEFFTMPGFLEIESLSPLQKLEPQKKIWHREEWKLKRISGNRTEEYLNAIESLGGR